VEAGYTGRKNRPGRRVSEEPFVARLWLGDAAVAAINEGTALWAPELTATEREWRPEIPEADEQGRIPINFITVNVEIGERSIVIDPGFDDPIGQPTSPGDTPAWPRAHRTKGLRAGLAEAGIDPAAVTDVLITHTHVDHFRGVTMSSECDAAPRFPGARVWLTRRDWEDDPEQDDLESDISVRLGRIHQLGLLELVDADVEVAPGVTMTHAPGESPGHSIVRIESGGETLYVLGDLFHHGCEIAHVEWKTPWSDGAALMESRRRVLEEAFERDAVLMFTHDRFPPWFRLARSGSEYRKVPF
jgi:glyoxylase-like metal-dependent hydrolase (beta-lactamase superfamily II)